MQNRNSLSGTFVWLMAIALCSLLFLPSSSAFGDSKAAGTKQANLATPAEVGSWTDPLDLCPANGHCLPGVNFALMFNGKVLFYYYPQQGSGPGSRALVLDPTSGAITEVTVTDQRDIFCSGISILPNGQVLATGGNKLHASNKHSGTNNTTIFDPTTSSWILGQSMNFARWYPTSLELGTGKILEFSGPNEDGTLIQNAVESYDYTTGVWTTLPAAANMPPGTLDGTAYPRMSLLKTGKIFLSLPLQQSYLFDPVALTWKPSAMMNFGKRYFAPHVLLPGLTQIMVAGGNTSSVDGQGATTGSVEIIDTAAAHPAWTYVNSMLYPRMNANLVILADGKVLAIGGGGGGGRYANPVLSSELYDPATGQWTLMATQQAPRTYHSSAGLLPDGRVLSAGADDGGPLQASYEIYSPPYMFSGTRPVITSAPKSVLYNKQFTIKTPDAASITRVALIRSAVTTHANAMDQRYVDLSFQVGAGQIKAKSPLNGNYAPPGYYLLVIVNSSGIPSVMPFVQLSLQ